MAKKTTDIKSDCKHAKFLGKNMHKFVHDLTSANYHGMIGTWSSSQFKDMLDDEDYFIRKYIKKEVERSETDAMDTGTYMHTALLEPHKIDEEIAVYPGKVRAGKAYQEFRAANAGKCIIIPSQRDQGDLMVKAVKASPSCMEYLEGEPEVSLFVELVIWNGSIYAPHYGKVLTRTGWEDAGNTKNMKGYTMVVKVRADTLGDTFVSDLKSTSGNARKEHDIRTAISKYKYDLSAALYLDMFALPRPSVREFVWVFASKQTNNAAPWRASAAQILVGRAKYMRAIIRLADCAQANWETVDCLREAEPLPYEREWLVEKDTDLL